MVSRAVRNPVVILLLLVFFAVSIFVLQRGQVAKRTEKVNVTKEVLVEDVIEYRLNNPEQYTIRSALGEDEGEVQYTRVAVVPHHLVAAKAIPYGVRAFANNGIHPSTIVVLSPDHFHKCSSAVCTTEHSFRSVFGTTTVNKGYVAALLDTGVAMQNTDLFKNEHGVYSVLPFISHYYPETTVVPIVVSQKRQVSAQEREQLLSSLLNLMKDEGTVLLVSSDFSHYLPFEEAELQDKETQESLSRMDGEAILALDNPAQSDCPLCLWVANEVAVSLSYANTAFLWHSNSAVLLGDRGASDTTSHFVVTYSR